MYDTFERRFLFLCFCFFLNGFALTLGLFLTLTLLAFLCGGVFALYAGINRHRSAKSSIGLGVGNGFLGTGMGVGRFLFLFWRCGAAAKLLYNFCSAHIICFRRPRPHDRTSTTRTDKNGTDPAPT